MSRWYRAYEGTVSDPKIAEVAVIAGCSRAVAIATWHAVLESAAGTRDEGRFDTNARRVSITLNEPQALLDTVFSAMEEVGLIADSRVKKWTERQYESDISTERVKRFRENKKKATEGGNGSGGGESHVEGSETDVKRFSNVACNGSETPQRHRQRQSYNSESSSPTTLREIAKKREEILEIEGRVKDGLDALARRQGLAISRIVNPGYESIFELVHDGYDFQLHVRPGIERALRQGKKVRDWKTWKQFVKWIENYRKDLERESVATHASMEILQ
jgi:hypothetical protein